MVQILLYIYDAYKIKKYQKCRNNLDQTKLRCWFDKRKTDIKYNFNYQALNCKRNQNILIIYRALL